NSLAYTSRTHSKAYLRHLFKAKEMLAAQIATLHNLSFYLWLVNTAREKIISGEFYAWKEVMVKKLIQKI
ncbi:MAG: tRNA guanosine(34) transglycosylase Tgt, partial [Chitinophagales bacterium]